MSRRARQIGEAYEAALEREELGQVESVEEPAGTEVGWAARLKRVGVPLGGTEVGFRPIEIDAERIRFDLTWDRMGWGEDFEAFRASIEHEGQLQPIVVVRDPANPGSYLGAFGRRRHEALRQLQKPVKAIVVEADDDLRLIYQGIENGARRDRSFIEQALFAATLLAGGRTVETVTKALMVDDTVVSRMRSVVERVGVELIEAIGAAPRHGRPRWEELARRLAEDKAARARAEKAAAGEEAEVMGSDERFDRVMLAITARQPAAKPVELVGAGGKQVASMKRVGGGIKITTKNDALLEHFEEALREAARRFAEGQASS